MLFRSMHARIASGAGLPPSGEPAQDGERTAGVSRLVYKTVRGITRLVGGSADALLGLLGPALAAPNPRLPPRPEREAVVAALNGVLGDYLAATDNPLCIPMEFRQSGRRLDLDRASLRVRQPGVTNKLIVLLHGLCMSDLQWRRANHDHGEALARELGYTPVYLHYNSGLSVSTNGRILAPLMERLHDAWPMPLERLVLMGHSMGGLVARSAIHHAAQVQRVPLRWPSRVDDLICLGTPHQGAPLERAGNAVEVLLEAAPYAAPLARLAKLRSAGINDLRMGTIVSARADDSGLHAPGHVPLPERTRCYAIAGCLGRDTGGLKGKVLGDGLVPVASALGQHPEPGRRLGFAPDRQAVVYQTGHLELLSSAGVYGLLRSWLS